MNLDTDLHILAVVLSLLAAGLFARVIVLAMGRRRRRVVILGSGPMATMLATELKSGLYPRYALAGVIDDDKPANPAAARWLGPCGSLREIVTRLKPSLIVLAMGDRRQRLPLVSLLETRVRGTAVEEALEFYERLTGKMAIEAVTPTSLILGKGFRRRLPARLIARAVSATAAAVGLVIIAPLMAVLAVLIKLDSKGPVFFVQDRAGKYGRPFRLLKLRTMHACEEKRSEWVQDNTDRITGVGKWLRRYRFDELPQLLNVLRGDMNLIGPRPHPTRNQAIFMERIAYYGIRCSIRPGITGWAQVRYGYANNLEEETEKMRYDLYYIKNRSVWLDVRILFATIGTVFLGRGATTVRRPSQAQRRPVPPPVWSPLT
jgi:exopolysaccharide biosynthesis polyprenyl glycosylphosphotransferase